MGKRKRMVSGVRYTYQEVTAGHNEKEFKRFDPTVFQFDICCLSYTNLDEPFICPLGYSFDYEAANEYFSSHSKHPYADYECKIEDLVKAKITYDKTQTKIDPLTEKVLSNRGKVVINRKSGYVYQLESIQDLNYQVGFMFDLMTGQEFTRSDIVVIHDPDREIKYPIDPIVSFKRVIIESQEIKTAKELIKSFGIKASKNFEESHWALAAPTKESYYKALEIKANPPKSKSVITMLTSLGELVLDLDCDSAPMGVINFLGHALRGNYSNMRVNKIEPGQYFVVTSSSIVDESVWSLPFSHEKNENRRGYKYQLFFLETGKKELKLTNTSCFCISAETQQIDRFHIIGGVTRGESIIDQVCNGKIFPNGAPVNAFSIKSVTIFSNPFK